LVEDQKKKLASDVAPSSSAQTQAPWFHDTFNCNLHILFQLSSCNETCWLCCQRLLLWSLFRMKWFWCSRWECLNLINLLLIFWTCMSNNLLQMPLTISRAESSLISTTGN
jgi:hypothetical protein